MALGLRKAIQNLQSQLPLWQRSFHATASLDKARSGRYRVTLKRTRPLTYEMANPPHYLAHRKSWNAWNTSNVEGGPRSPEIAFEDEFIRRFMTGTWHNIFLSELCIKRNHNVVRIVGIIKQNLGARKLYFLIGYTQELLSYWLQCPVKLELQSVTNPEDVIFKYI